MTVEVVQFGFMALLIRAEKETGTKREARYGTHSAPDRASGTCPTSVQDSHRRNTRQAGVERLSRLRSARGTPSRAPLYRNGEPYW